MANNRRLSDRDEAFCEEYLKDLSPKHAALRAGYAETTAADAYKWLKAGNNIEKPAVRVRIEQLIAERSARCGVTADRVLQELARVAFVDPTRVIDPETGAVREDASDDDRAAIAAVRVKSGEMFDEHEVRMADKLKALELLGKHLNMFTDNVSLTVDVPQIVDIDGSGEG